jgi:protein involved in polysaccharide export with SLBB domain
MRILLYLSILLLGGIISRAQMAAPQYKLSPMDKLSVSVTQDPVAGKPVEINVSPLGDVTVPVSRCCEDSVTVTNIAGRTIEDVEKLVAQKLEMEFYEKATVQIRLVDAAKRKGQVLFKGQVRQNVLQLEPGKPKTLWEALTEVGTTDYANLKKVKLDRAGQAVKIYNVDAVGKGDRTKDVELQDGDRVTVEEKSFNF